MVTRHKETAGADYRDSSQWTGTMAVITPCNCCPDGCRQKSCRRPETGRKEASTALDECSPAIIPLLCARLVKNGGELSGKKRLSPVDSHLLCSKVLIEATTNADENATTSVPFAIQVVTRNWIKSRT